jgi:hypothetical protein
METRYRLCFGVVLLVASLSMFFTACKNDESYYNPPTLTTGTVSQITSHTAQCSGKITYTGGAPVLEKGLCWSTSPDPTTADQHTINGMGNNEFTNTITELLPSTLYYVRAYASNVSGTAYGAQRTFTTSEMAFVPGEPYQGGIIAYVFQIGDSGYVQGENHGLIVTPTDLSLEIKWCGDSLFLIGAGQVENEPLGEGVNATKKIVDSIGEGTYAAKLCYDLVLDGFDDWYLPGIRDLTKVIEHEDLIGEFQGIYYWSSTEYDAENALVYVRSLNQWHAKQKDSKFSVRAVRKF